MKNLHRCHFLSIAGSCIITTSAGLLDTILADNSNQACPLDDWTQFRVYATSLKSVEGELQFIFSDKKFYGNEETQKWLVSLDGHVILDTGEDNLVVNRFKPTPPTFDEDNVCYKIIKCKVFETIPLGTGLVDYLLVNDIELVGNETVSYDEIYNSSD